MAQVAGKEVTARRNSVDDNARMQGCPKALFERAMMIHDIMMHLDISEHGSSETHELHLERATVNSPDALAVRHQAAVNSTGRNSMIMYLFRRSNLHPTISVCQAKSAE